MKQGLGIPLQLTRVVRVVMMKCSKSWSRLGLKRVGGGEEKEITTKVGSGPCFARDSGCFAGRRK